MPTVMAQAVMRIGRNRSWAPARAASGTTLPPCHSMAMNVTIITEFDTETPMHMIAPMNDSMLSVVPVRSSMVTTPHSTPGTDDTDARASRSDWKYAVSSTRITATARPKPMPSAVNIWCMGATWPRSSTRTPFGGWPAAAMACSTCREARPRSSPSTLAVMLR